MSMRNNASEWLSLAAATVAHRQGGWMGQEIVRSYVAVAGVVMTAVGLFVAQQISLARLEVRMAGEIVRLETEAIGRKGIYDERNTKILADQLSHEREDEIMNARVNDVATRQSAVISRIDSLQRELDRQGKEIDHIKDAHTQRR